MALPSNVQCSLDGSPLPFFFPHPTPRSSGVNVFSQLPANQGGLHTLRSIKSQSYKLFALLLFLIFGLEKFGGLYFNHILHFCWHLLVRRMFFSPPPPLPLSLAPLGFPHLSPLVLLNLIFSTFCYQMPS